MAVNKVTLGNQTIIDLTGDTISAGDALVGVSLHLASGESAVGTLGDFTGATSSAAGTHGLVPAPAAGDNAKFLRGDGTWQTAGGSSATAMTEAEIQTAFDEGWPAGYTLTLSLVSPIHTSDAYTPCVTIDQYSSTNVDAYGQYVDVIDGATIDVSDPLISNASFTLDPTAVAFTVAPHGSYPTNSPAWGVTCTGGVAQDGFSMGQNKFTITADGTLVISGIDYNND